MTNNSSQYSPDEETNFSGIEIFLLYELRIQGLACPAGPGWLCEEDFYDI